MTNTITTGVGALLPLDARKRLMEATKIVDPKQKARAIEEAIRRARLQYPQYFQQEKQP